MFKIKIKRELAQWYKRPWYKPWSKRPTINQKPARLPWIFKTARRHAYVSEKRTYHQRTVWVLTPTRAPSRKTIFYLHGGAYLYNLTSYHWRFLSSLCNKTQARIVIPDYPLAPQANCEEVYTFIEPLYSEWLEHSPDHHLIIMGDSAGGGLALGLAQRLKSLQKPQPTQIILLAPWLDIELKHPDTYSLEIIDPLLDRGGLIKAGEAYRGGLEANDPRVSPLYGEIASLGTLSIFVSTSDLLWPDCQDLHHRLQDQGVAHNYFEYPEVFHVWMMVTSLPEARHAMRQIASLILEPSPEERTA